MDITKIYLVTNCIGDPNKVYIGKTKNCEGRLKNSRKYVHQKRFGKDIIFTYIDQVESYNKEDWELLESFWIEYFRYLGFELMNKNKGGGGSEYCTQETKNKIRQSSIGLKRHNKNSRFNISQALKGHKHNDETKAKISKIHKGKNVTEETKKRISNSNKGKKRTQEIIDNLKKRNRDKVFKVVLQYDLEGNFIQEWPSIKEAASSLNLRFSTEISRCCRGEKRQVKGYIFRFKNNNKVKNLIIPKPPQHSKIPILQYDLEGNFIKEWPSISEASINIIGKFSSSISSVIRGKTKSAHGYLWGIKK